MDVTWEPEISLEDLVFCVAEYSDLATPVIARHHLQVAAIARAIGEEAGFPADEIRTIALAGALHDIGAFSLRERIDLMAFETEKPHEHARLGMLLLRDFHPLQAAAELVLHHHVRQDESRNGTFEGRPVNRGSLVLHLADRVAVLIDREPEVLGQVPEIRQTIRARSGSMFRRDLVDAFMALSSRESFWFGITADDLEPSLRHQISPSEHPLSVDNLLSLGEIATRIIDYKSAFTASHSRGVAATATTISWIHGFNDDQCSMMHFAGLLHDIGKLAVPSEIIEKQASLSDGETNRMRSHAYHTWKAFERFRGMDEARAWAAYHHEHLDGTGYPFHLKDEQICTGSRILAVADVYTALTEDRPYRPGMSPTDAVGLIRTMAQNRSLDPAIVSTLADNVRAVDSSRHEAQEEAADSFRALHLAV